MSKTIQADTSELKELEDMFDQAVKRLLPEMAKVTSKGALNIKNDWRKRWSDHPKIRHLPRAIAYDMKVGANSVEAEIGPDKQKMQGPLGNIIEFGTVNNAPIPGGKPALDTEEDKYVRAIAKAAEGLFGRSRVG